MTSYALSPPSPVKATAVGGEPYSLENDADARLRPEDFVRGKWEVELNDWSRHCVPNGWMVCCLPCVSIAQISVRIGTDSYGSALAKQLALNILVLALVALELVYVVRLSSPDKGNTNWTPLFVIWSVIVIVLVITIYWVRSLAKLRAAVRERFEIDGSAGDDKHAMAWCTPCAIAQMATQVKSYTPGSCAFGAPDALPAYIP